MINRTETQARDIFDLNLLLNCGVKPECLNETLRKSIETAITHTMSVGFQEFKGHVVAYLLNEYQEYYNDPKIWNTMQSKIISMLERLH